MEWGLSYQASSANRAQPITVQTLGHVVFIKKRADFSARFGGVCALERFQVIGADYLQAAREAIVGLRARVVPDSSGPNVFLVCVQP
jgi:hypothetical protein